MHSLVREFEFVFGEVCLVIIRFSCFIVIVGGNQNSCLVRYVLSSFVFLVLL